jgi:hypothetical protein
MQQILFVAAKKWFCVATRRHRRSKIETFEIASLDVQRQRAMLWGTTTGYLSGFLHVAFSRAQKNALASFRVNEIAKTKVLRERDR